MILTTDSKRTVASEIMINTPGIKECILGNDELKNIYTYIKAGRGKGGNGSQTFDQHIMSLFQKGIITEDVAKKASTNASDFAQKLIME